MGGFEALGKGEQLMKLSPRYYVRLTRSILVPVLCASLMAPALLAVSASAAPLPKPGIAKDENITKIQGRGRGWRRGYGYRRGPYRRGYRRGYGAGALIGGIIAGTLIAAAIRERRAGDDDMRRCAYEFRSFDPVTGTYITYEGEERVCPYLY